MRWPIVVLMLAFLLLLPYRAADAFDGALVGSWAGTLENGDPGRPVRLTLAREGSGFVVDADLPGIVSGRSRMVPTDQPGVFQEGTRERLFSFFESSTRSNPFDGAPMLWSRSTEHGLVIYRLTIGRDGTAELLRLALEADADAATLAVERRHDGEPPERWQARLEQRG